MAGGIDARNAAASAAESEPGGEERSLRGASEAVVDVVFCFVFILWGFEKSERSSSEKGQRRARKHGKREREDAKEKRERERRRLRERERDPPEASPFVAGGGDDDGNDGDPSPSRPFPSSLPLALENLSRSRAL